MFDRAIRRKLMIIYLPLGSLNIGLWVLALMLFHHHPVQLGSAFLAYSFGLRHAVDADHIAAIDNVTRKLVQSGQRPLEVGLFFSLGHSTVVVALSLALGLAASAMRDHIALFADVGGIIGSTVSITFLLVIATINLVVLVSICRTFQRVRRGERYRDDDIDILMTRPGLLSLVFRRLFRLVERSWHMYPIGVLFGFGFDTATEIALLSLSATEAARSSSIWWFMIYPALFTAGMSLIDTLDSTMMTGAYGWARIKPIRKLYYNMIITAASVLVAVLIGGVQVLGLIRSHWGLSGGGWEAVGIVTDHFGMLGYAVVAVFLLSWIISLIFDRFRGLGQRDAPSG